MFYPLDPESLGSQVSRSACTSGAAQILRCYQGTIGVQMYPLRHCQAATPVPGHIVQNTSWYQYTALPYSRKPYQQ